MNIARIKTSNGLLFYLLLIGFMCIDIYSSFGLGRPLIYSLLCLYAVAVSHRLQNTRLMLLLALLALESFFFYGQWGIQLIYLIPMALIARKTWDTFCSCTCHALFILLTCLVVQIFFIDSLLGTNPFSMFTILKIFINIVLTISISLTY